MTLKRNIFENFSPSNLKSIHTKHLPFDKQSPVLVYLLFIKMGRSRPFVLRYSHLNGSYILLAYKKIQNGSIWSQESASGHDAFWKRTFLGPESPGHLSSWSPLSTGNRGRGRVWGML